MAKNKNKNIYKIENLTKEQGSLLTDLYFRILFILEFPIT